MGIRNRRPTIRHPRGSEAGAVPKHGFNLRLADTPAQGGCRLAAGRDGQERPSSPGTGLMKEHWIDLQNDAEHFESNLIC